MSGRLLGFSQLLNQPIVRFPNDAHPCNADEFCERIFDIENADLDCPQQQQLQ